jgi:hypothetical protein
MDTWWAWPLDLASTVNDRLTRLRNVLILMVREWLSVHNTPRPRMPRGGMFSEIAKSIAVALKGTLRVGPLVSVFH